MISPYEVLDRKRRGEELGAEEIAALVDGAVDGSWEDAQLAAFLMAVAIRGLAPAETRQLTSAMLDSGERWSLSSEVPLLGDKHSTGGVGDKVSIVLAPVMAACGLPIAMLTGRGLGHTAGTADKLEGIPGLDLRLERRDMLARLEASGMAIGIATDRIAPADRKLYALRDVTGTVASNPLITASILSKKLALGAGGVVYDVKTGSGAFLEDPGDAGRLARMLVETSIDLGCPATALVTDMSQPLGRWVGHDAEILESLDCLEGAGAADLRRLVTELGVALAELLGVEVDSERIGRALDSGEAREIFLAWAVGQGAEPSWAAEPRLPLAPVETTLRADSSGTLLAVDTRRLGLLLAVAGGGRRNAGDAIDHGVSLRCDRRIGDAVVLGEELGRVYLRREDAELVRRLEDCFTVGGVEERGGAGEARRPVLIVERVPPPA